MVSFSTQGVQRTIKSSKNTVRTGVFVGHAVRHLINSMPKPHTRRRIIRSQKITVRTEVFVGQGIRWTRGGGGNKNHSTHVYKDQTD